MTSKELIELSREYENCDSVSRRKEIWDSVEYATRVVFRNLCHCLDGYAEQHNVSTEWPADCYFSWDCERDCLPYDDPEGLLDNPGVTVTYEMANGQESVLTIPYGYFDCTDDDWKKMLEEKNAKTDDEPKLTHVDGEEDEYGNNRQPSLDRPCADVSHFEVLARIESMRDQVEEMGRQLTKFEKTLDRLNFDIMSAAVPRRRKDS